MNRRNDGKATVALAVAVFAAVIAVTALAVLFWSGGVGWASQDGSPAPALQTNAGADTGSATAKPTTTMHAKDQPLAKQALERLRVASDTLAGTAESLAEMQINDMLLKLSGLQKEVESLRSGCIELAGALKTLTQALNGPVGGTDDAAITQAAEALEQADAALIDEMTALKQAKQSKNLDAIGQGLARMDELVDKACETAQGALALVQQ